jgi:hypothetical protein
MQPMLVWLIPAAHPEQGPIIPPGQPPGIWGGAPLPSPGHPLPPGIWGGAPLPQPPGIWPGPGYPSHPIAPGGQPPGIWPGPGYPSHPIAPGGQPPGIWPGPGQPSHPIVLPNPPGDAKPEHPIALPGVPEAPQNPSVMPPGTMQPPADLPGEPAGTSVWVLGYFPGLEWRWVTVTT